MYFNGEQGLFGHVCVTWMGNKINISRICGGGGGGLAVRWMDGWMDGWVGGWVNGRTDRKTDR
jgi:hypothetical protein